MKSEFSSDGLAIPPALLAEVKAAAEEERQRARDLGIHEPADDLPMSDEYRQSVREKIAQGMQSLREGKGTDGESFFAEMYAELDELERQGRE